jgi:hypothetical protein
VLVAIGIIGILIFAGLMVLAYWGFVNLATFLTMTRPVVADVLVIEGWIPDFALEQASKEFWQGGYKTIVTTGPPLLRGTYLSEYKTHADLAAATLKAMGVPPELIISLPCPNADRFRTYTSALAVQHYLGQGPSPVGINLFTQGCHARRSWYIYHRLLTPTQIKVGIIPMANHTFDLQQWWTTSSGVRTVVGELIAYLYVRLVRWDG